MPRPEFQSHELSNAGLEKVGIAKEAFSDLLDKLEPLIPPSRPRSEVITLLQTACQWAVRGIAEDTTNHRPHPSDTVAR